MNILFLGSSGPLSLIPLKFLLETEHKLCAIGFESSSDVSLEGVKYPIIASQNETVEMLARKVGVPAIKLFDKDGEYIDAIKSTKPDIIIVSCLTGKLPESILNMTPLGCFNLHPSLLPAFRGPVPLFWQFRTGVEEFGMTLHRMNSSYDKGPIIAQTKLAMSDGITNRQATEVLAHSGSGLLDLCLDKIAHDEIVEQIQNESEASYMSYPEDMDFSVSTLWSARRMYNFISATRHWGKTYPCNIAGREYRLVDVKSYRAMNGSEPTFSVNEDIITIPCVDGFVIARMAHDQPFPV